MPDLRELIQGIRKQQGADAVVNPVDPIENQARVFDEFKNIPRHSPNLTELPDMATFFEGLGVSITGENEEKPTVGKRIAGYAQDLFGAINPEIGKRQQLRRDQLRQEQRQQFNRALMLYESDTRGKKLENEKEIQRVKGLNQAINDSMKIFLGFAEQIDRGKVRDSRDAIAAFMKPNTKEAEPPNLDTDSYTKDIALYNKTLAKMYQRPPTQNELTDAIFNDQKAPTSIEMDPMNLTGHDRHTLTERLNSMAFKSTVAGMANPVAMFNNWLGRDFSEIVETQRASEWFGARLWPLVEKKVAINKEKQKDKKLFEAGQAPRTIVTKENAALSNVGEWVTKVARNHPSKLLLVLPFDANQDTVSSYWDRLDNMIPSADMARAVFLTNLRNGGDPEAALESLIATPELQDWHTNNGYKNEDIQEYLSDFAEAIAQEKEDIANAESE